MLNEYYTHREKYLDYLKEAEQKRLLAQARKATKASAAQAARYPGSMDPGPRKNSSRVKANRLGS